MHYKIIHDNPCSRTLKTILFPCIAARCKGQLVQLGLPGWSIYLPARLARDISITYHQNPEQNCSMKQHKQTFVSRVDSNMCFFYQSPLKKSTGTTFHSYFSAKLKQTLAFKAQEDMIKIKNIYKKRKKKKSFVFHE